jgi:hypothetical protein
VGKQKIPSKLPSGRSYCWFKKKKKKKFFNFFKLKTGIISHQLIQSTFGIIDSQINPLLEKFQKTPEIFEQEISPEIFKNLYHSFRHLFLLENLLKTGNYQVFPISSENLELLNFIRKKNIPVKILLEKVKGLRTLVGDMASGKFPSVQEKLPKKVNRNPLSEWLVTVRLGEKNTPIKK